ncbi:hypothetical protein SAMN05444404_3175 [Ruegeria lacuscaerulensis ITI-1157]|nr:hypothetical protein SAMN05444404_3175 [Ruegeria lacuscaerulensis ITI-1157]
MTRICFEQSDHTKANQATAHNRSDVGATAPEPLPRAQRVEGPRSIQRAFERFNAPQMRRDRQREWLDALPPTWLMLIAGFTCLITLLIADTLYSAFFRWMVG